MGRGGGEEEDSKLIDEEEEEEEEETTHPSVERKPETDPSAYREMMSPM